MSDISSNWLDDFHFAAVSDVGMRRANNQDSYLTLVADSKETWLNRGHLFIVADGMGAHAAGELASKLAVDGVAHHYRKRESLSAPDAILQALRDTNTEIHQRGKANTEFYNMGTTCSALTVLPQGVVVAHVGDSRVYRIRGHRIEQLTFDHSLQWEMRAAGSIAARDAANIPKNVITRSLGPQESVQIDVEGPVQVRQGDRFLMCSDGLTGKLEDDEIGAIVAAVSAPDEAAQFLVDMANLRGGPDNITVIIVQAAGPAAASHHWRGVQPLMVGRRRESDGRVHVAIWIVLAVSLLIAAGTAIVQQRVGMVASLVVAAVAMVIAIWQRFSGDMGIALKAGRRLGRSPYAAASVTVSEALATRLCRSVQQTIDSVAERWDGRERAEACVAEAMKKCHDGDPIASLKLLAVAARLVAQQMQLQYRSRRPGEVG